MIIEIQLRDEDDTDNILFRGYEPMRDTLIRAGWLRPGEWQKMSSAHQRSTSRRVRNLGRLMHDTISHVREHAARQALYGAGKHLIKIANELADEAQELHDTSPPFGAVTRDKKYQAPMHVLVSEMITAAEIATGGTR